MLTPIHLHFRMALRGTSPWRYDLGMSVVLTREQIRRVDHLAINHYGIPGPVLMENAGRGATRVLREHFQDLRRDPVILVCGAGNNGGDGFVIARDLQKVGIQSKVFLLVEPDRIRGDARIYFDAIHAMERALSQE